MGALLAPLSLLVLAAAIAISLKTKLHLGILAIAAAFLLGCFVPSTDGAMMSLGKAAELTAGFNYTLWLTLMSISIFFGIGQENGTLEKLTQKMVYAVKGSRAVIAMMFFVAAFVLSSTGLGGIGATMLMMPFAAQVSRSEGIPFLLPCYGIAVGGAAGSFSPVGSFKAIADSLAAQAGLPPSESLYIRYILCGTICFFLLFFLLRGHQLGRSTATVKTKPFCRNEWITLLGIVAFGVMGILFQLDVGMSAILIACIVALLTGADMERILKTRVPWNTLVMLGGIGILVNVVSKAGGIDLLVDLFSSFMGPKTAAPVLLIVAGLMSFVSSATGAVYPALIPTIPGIVAATGASSQALINAVCYGALQSGISPLSVTGALILSLGGDNIDQKKTFRDLFLLAFTLVLLGALFSYIGLLN